MNILLKQVTVVDPSSPFHLQKADVFIQNGIITSIKNPIDEQPDITFEAPAAFISPGWVDVFADFSDPGYEYRENLQTGAGAAAAGGYTDVFIVPNTLPVVHSKGGVEYIVQKGKNLPVTLHPIGAITKNTEGKELAEMYDMHQSGAICFSDGINPLQSSGIMLKALQYVKAVDSPLIQLPDDKAINVQGVMNEGIASTLLGLPGRPPIAEEIMVARDIELVKYTGSKIHITGVSTKKSISLIRKAKKEGIAVTCSVTPYHLFYCDEDLKEYNTHLKVNPPLRSPTDRKAVRDAVLDGTVDCLATHHLPQDRDHKMVEFEYAQNGMIGLQTCFAVVNSVLPILGIEKMIELLAIHPRKIFGLDPATININQRACLSIFNMEAPFIFSREMNLSKSSNSPFFDTALTGRVYGIINKEELFLNEYSFNGK